MNLAKNEAVEIVRMFWDLMATNDFDSVGQVLAENFTLEWPQSNERIRGAANFSRMNYEYPAEGPWRFIVNRVVGNGNEAASDVSVTDGVLRARAISFFTMSEGKISRIVEFWPDDYLAPANRRHLVEPIS